MRLTPNIVVISELHLITLDKDEVDLVNAVPHLRRQQQDTLGVEISISLHLQPTINKSLSGLPYRITVTACNYHVACYASFCSLSCQDR